MAIESLKDIVTRQLESKYILGEKVFEAKISQSISRPIENSLAYNLLVLIRHLYNENPSVHIWRKKISMEATELEITKEVTEAIQSGFVNEE